MVLGSREFTLPGLLRFNWTLKGFCYPVYICWRNWKIRWSECLGSSRRNWSCFGPFIWKHNRRICTRWAILSENWDRNNLVHFQAGRHLLQIIACTYQRTWLAGRSFGGPSELLAASRHMVLIPNTAPDWIFHWSSLSHLEPLLCSPSTRKQLGQIPTIR
jgi:hypothetical protein